jgi:hypothetical protein
MVSAVTRVLLLFLVVACSSDRATPPSPTETFHTRGRVEAVSSRAIDLHHEAMSAIRTYDGTLKPMASMTMPFAPPPAGIGGIEVGDVIEIDFSVHTEGAPLRIVKLTELPRDTALVLE